MAPTELSPPPSFRPDDPRTWANVVGRLEYTQGRLWLLPPCGDEQQDVAASLVGVVEPWSLAHRDYIVGANEAGMILGGEVRGADAAVWLRATAGPRTGGYRRVAPILAVEVAGRDEEEAALLVKARWYLDHGVRVVWIVLPAERAVVVVDGGGSRRLVANETIEARDELPGLTTTVERLFRQL